MTFEKHEMCLMDRGSLRWCGIYTPSPEIRCEEDTFLGSGLQTGKQKDSYVIIVWCLARDQFQVSDSLWPKGPGSLIAANYRLKGPSDCYTSAPGTLTGVWDDMWITDLGCVCVCRCVCVCVCVEDCRKAFKAPYTRIRREINMPVSKLYEHVYPLLNTWM